MIPGAAEVESFRAAVAARLGLAFDHTRAGSLAEVLGRKAEASGVTIGEYLQRLREPGHLSTERVGALARGLTVGETYFFRDPAQLRAFREVALVERLPSRSPLRILSAGCSSGEEPYTLAIVLREAQCSDASITAVDVDPDVLQRAARMRYSPWSLREMSPQGRDAWFRRDGQDYVLRPEVGDRVRFEARNLADADSDLFAPRSFDVVFCRNVLMYFTPEAAKRVVAAFAGSLVPGGHLFLGHAENLRGLSHEFRLCHTHGTFYYQRQSEAGAAAAGAARVYDPPRPPESWFDAIQGATERVRSMAEARSAMDSASSPPARTDLGPATELLRRERFAEALAVLNALPRPEAEDTDALLLQAVLQLQTGDVGEAERTGQALLRVDDLNAGAHYVLALCCEARGNESAAAEHDRIACHLDPSFAMPLLHLGQLATRIGEAERARSSFDRALVLLEQEDPARILLFGGGFTRESLMALCRSHLAKGVRP